MRGLGWLLLPLLLGGCGMFGGPAKPVSSLAAQCEQPSELAKDPAYRDELAKYTGTSGASQVQWPAMQQARQRAIQACIRRLGGQRGGGVELPNR